MERLNPGISIGPYELGMTLGAALGRRDDWEREQRNPQMVVLTAGGWSLFFEDDLLTQVGAEEPLEVSGPYNLSLGVTLNEVDGDLVWNPDDCVLSIDGEPGLTIDVSTEGNEIEEPEVDGDSRIVWLGVHVPPDEDVDFEFVELY